MPTKKLTEREHRRIVLRALDGESVTRLAREHGISPQHAWKMVRQARATAADNLAYWRRVNDRIEERGSQP